MKSIIGLFKTECLQPGPFVKGPLAIISDVEFATMAWVDWWNNRRLHSSIGMVPPAEHEVTHYLQTAAPQPAAQLTMKTAANAGRCTGPGGRGTQHLPSADHGLGPIG